MTGIIEKQNAPEQLRQLAAQRQLYATVKKVLGFSFWMSVVIAVLLAFLCVFNPSLKGYVGIWSAFVLFADFFWWSTWQKDLRDKAARIQEAFDCTVLSMPWNEVKAGKEVEPEVVNQEATKYKKWAHKMSPLEDWYSKCVQELPVHLGRLISQRSNCRWDSNQRRLYANILVAILALIGVSALYIAAVTGKTINDAVLEIVLPLLPTFSWGIRQIKEHRDAADRLDKLRAHIEKVWGEALNGLSPEMLLRKARVIQDEIFDSRKRNTPVFDSLFRMLRDKEEASMNHGSEMLVAEAKKRLG